MRGFPETRIADVAERAGTNPALVSIYYFKTKDNLLTEAMRYAEDSWYDLGARRNGGDRQRRQAARGDRGHATCLPQADAELPNSWTLWLDLWAQSVRHPEVARMREEFDNHWRETIATVVRDGQEVLGEQSHHATPTPPDFSVTLSALLDGLAIQIALKDSVVDPIRAFDASMRFAAQALGFPWSPASTWRWCPGSNRADEHRSRDVGARRCRPWPIRKLSHCSNGLVVDAISGPLWRCSGGDDPAMKTSSSGEVQIVSLASASATSRRSPTRPCTSLAVSSFRSWAPPVAARRLHCDWWPASNSRPAGASSQNRRGDVAHKPPHRRNVNTVFRGLLRPLPPSCRWPTMWPSGSKHIQSRPGNGPAGGGGRIGPTARLRETSSCRCPVVAGNNAGPARALASSIHRCSCSTSRCSSRRHRDELCRWN